MLLYALIGLSLVLLGIVGLQFTYMFYLERVYGERKKYLAELERRLAESQSKLDLAESRIAEQQQFIHDAFPELREADEPWPHVIED